MPISNSARDEYAKTQLCAYDLQKNAVMLFRFEGMSDSIKKAGWMLCVRHGKENELCKLIHHNTLEIHPFSSNHKGQEPEELNVEFVETRTALDIQKDRIYIFRPTAGISVEIEKARKALQMISAAHKASCGDDSCEENCSDVVLYDQNGKVCHTQNTTCLTKDKHRNAQRVRMEFTSTSGSSPLYMAEKSWNLVRNSLGFSYKISDESAKKKETGTSDTGRNVITDHAVKLKDRLTAKIKSVVAPASPGSKISKSRETHAFSKGSKMDVRCRDCGGWVPRTVPQNSDCRLTCLNVSTCSPIFTPPCLSEVTGWDIPPRLHATSGKVSRPESMECSEAYKGCGYSECAACPESSQYRHTAACWPNRCEGDGGLCQSAYYAGAMGYTAGCGSHAPLGHLNCANIYSPYPCYAEVPMAAPACSDCEAPCYAGAPMGVPAHKYYGEIPMATAVPSGNTSGWSAYRA